MATVYKAYDTRLEADVAVKVIRTENLAPSVLERALKRFEREAKALARLTHPNIVKVTDFGEHEGKPFLVLEYLPGGTLKKRLGKPIEWQEAMRLLLPIARALDYSHRQNMIHRDVKPSNILITADDEPMLTDFGIAKVLDLEETADLTGTGLGIGTPEYMAPEQWTGQTSLQSDLYSLGVVLYEMITGRKPYTAETPAAILLKQATEPLPRPSELVNNLPEEIEKILIKALARDPNDRFKDMGEFTKALERSLKLNASLIKHSKPQPSSKPTENMTDTLATVNQDWPEKSTGQTPILPNKKEFGRTRQIEMNKKDYSSTPRKVSLQLFIVLAGVALLVFSMLFTIYNGTTQPGTNLTFIPSETSSRILDDLTPTYSTSFEGQTKETYTNTPQMTMTPLIAETRLSNKIIFLINNDLYSMNPDGTEKKLLMYDQVNARVSQDGTTLAYDKDGAIELMDIVTKTITRMEYPELKYGYLEAFLQPAWPAVHEIEWFPSGKMLAFSFKNSNNGTEGIGTLDLSDGSYYFNENFTFSDNPVVSPEENQILFYSFNPSSTMSGDYKTGIYSMNPNGGGVGLFLENGPWLGNASWCSNDIRKLLIGSLLFNIYNKNGYEISIDGENFIWSPDCTNIVYNKDGDVFIVSFDGKDAIPSNERNITKTPNVEEIVVQWLNP